MVGILKGESVKSFSKGIAVALVPILGAFLYLWNTDEYAKQAASALVSSPNFKETFGAHSVVLKRKIRSTVSSGSSEAVKREYTFLILGSA
jgi:hypothetical protein